MFAEFTRSKNPFRYNVECNESYTIWYWLKNYIFPDIVLKMLPQDLTKFKTGQNAL